VRARTEILVVLAIVAMTVWEAAVPH